MEPVPIATTFLHDDHAVEVELLSGPTSSGLFIVQPALGGNKFVRHADRLTPVNEQAKKLLRKG